MLAPQTSIDFGMVVRTPMIEITTIGAGGGSIAWVDKGGLAEHRPGKRGLHPRAGGLWAGQHRPTVTDANVVLGRIDPDNPIGGKLDRLDVEAAARAIDIHVGAKLGLTTTEAAEAILTVANSRMAGAIRLVSIERGFDPKRFAFMPFGGGGALHTGAMLKEVGIGRAIVPRYPGVTSAMGCVIADMRQDFVQTINSLTAGSTPMRAARRDAAPCGRGPGAAGRREIAVRGARGGVRTGHGLCRPDPHGRRAPSRHGGGRHRSRPHRGGDRGGLRRGLPATYGRLLKNGTRRVMNLRTAVIGRRPKFDLTTLAPQGGSVEAARRAAAGAFRRRLARDGDLRPAGPAGRRRDHGPAILVQPDTTVLIDPGLTGRVDAFGNTIIAPGRRRT
jgi:N-methylhydantoinase A